MHTMRTFTDMSNQVKSSANTAKNSQPIQTMIHNSPIRPRITPWAVITATQSDDMHETMYARNILVHEAIKAALARKVTNDEVRTQGTIGPRLIERLLDPTSASHKYDLHLFT